MKILLLIVLLCGIAFVGSEHQRILGWLQLAVSAEENTLDPGLVILRADNHDGKDEVWQRRYYYGKRTWGIRGSGVEESGGMWFDAFPGESGMYDVAVHAVLERDGNSDFSLSAGKRTLVSSSFPYFAGSKDCEARGGPGVIPLGQHHIEKGEKITFHAGSKYECGKNGSYGLWHEIHFVGVTD